MPTSIFTSDGLRLMTKVQQYIFKVLLNATPRVLIFHHDMFTFQTYPTMQCAAVRTQRSEMIAPPQLCPKDDCSEIWYGAEPSLASSPPTILVDLAFCLSSEAPSASTSDHSNTKQSITKRLGPILEHLLQISKQFQVLNASSYNSN